VRPDQPDVRAEAALSADGHFEILGLPDGDWDVRAAVQTPNGLRLAVGAAKAGESVDLQLMEASAPARPGSKR
jgi:hypothetical protein